jgi:hypothetical protein
VASNYVRITGLADLFAEARELSVGTMIFDVEPLVAPWHGSQESLDQGIARILGDARTVPSLRVVVFLSGRLRVSCARSASPARAAFLSPDLGLMNSTGQRGGSAGRQP